jgi:hypothetical protein
MEIFAGLIVVLVVIYALIVIEDKLNEGDK